MPICKPSRRRKTSKRGSDLQSRLRSRLHPIHFFNISDRLSAIVGHVIDEQFVDPPIREMVVTNDGYVLARVGDDKSCRTFLGSYSDLMYDWKNLIAAARLSRDEWVEVSCRFAAKIGLYGAMTA
jgi:hypothetical protein